MIDNAIFVGYKPAFVSSNFYLQSIKRKFKIKKLGYSGTLDPFASGALLIATGSYTKLLSHLNLSPKVYIATLWLGVESSSLDIEKISKVNVIDEFKLEEIKNIFASMLGKITYTPPIYSAKKINGIRAYELARNGCNPELKENTSEIFDIEILKYNHPFLSFKISVEKGAYIRSIGDLIAKKLNTSGSLSNLIRIKEGDFDFKNYDILNPLEIIQYEKINLDEYKEDFIFGRKIILKDFKILKTTRYIVVFDDFFSIIEVDSLGEVKYILNKQKYLGNVNVGFIKKSK